MNFSKFLFSALSLDFTVLYSVEIVKGIVTVPGTSGSIRTTVVEDLRFLSFSSKIKFSKSEETVFFCLLRPRLFLLPHLASMVLFRFTRGFRFIKEFANVIQST